MPGRTLQTLALNLLQDASNYVLYFSIDDPVINATVPRLVSNLSMIPINTVANPLHRIDGNETIDEAEKQNLPVGISDDRAASLLRQQLR